MKKEDIIKLAQEAGFVIIDSYHEQAAERFAALVADAERDKWMERAAIMIRGEREACASVCDGISEDQWALYKGRPPYTGQELERASDYTQGKSDGAEVCAAAIRARKSTT